MKAVVIEEKAYAKMKQAFKEFSDKIEELCGNADIKKKWLDNQDVCLLLNIKKRTLQHYRDSGKIPFTMIGNKCYYKESDVEKLISDSQIK